MALKLSEGRKPNATNKHTALPMGHLTRMPHVGYFERHNFIYMITKSGRVFSLTGQFRHREMKQWDNGHGYRCVRMCGRKRVMRYVHRLVAEAFIPNPNKLHEVNHINGNKSDNRLSNLEWVDRRGNQLHRLHSDDHPLGFQSNAKKILIAKLAEKKMPRKRIAKQFGLHEQTITNICKAQGVRVIGGNTLKSGSFRFEKEILALAKRGAHMSFIAHELGIHVSAVRQVRAAHPEVEFKVGRGLRRHMTKLKPE